jgi:hypothetical protein
MPRDTKSDAKEVTRAIRIRTSEELLQKLERFSPAELGAWIVRIDRHMQEHAPESALEHWVPPESKKNSSRKKDSGVTAKNDGG